MRRYLMAIVIVLGVHTLATFAVKPYLNLLVDAGGLFVHNTDISSAWPRFRDGLLLVAGVLALAAIAITFLRGWVRLE